MNGRSGVWVSTIVVSSGRPAPPPSARASSSPRVAHARRGSPAAPCRAGATGGISRATKRKCARRRAATTAAGRLERQPGRQLGEDDGSELQQQLAVLGRGVAPRGSRAPRRGAPRAAGDRREPWSRSSWRACVRAAAAMVPAPRRNRAWYPRRPRRESSRALLQSRRPTHELRGLLRLGHDARGRAGRGGGRARAATPTATSCSTTRSARGGTRRVEDSPGGLVIKRRGQRQRHLRERPAGADGAARPGRHRAHGRRQPPGAARDRRNGGRRARRLDARGGSDARRPDPRRAAPRPGAAPRPRRPSAGARARRHATAAARAAPESPPAAGVRRASAAAAHRDAARRACGRCGAAGRVATALLVPPGASAPSRSAGRLRRPARWSSPAWARAMALGLRGARARGPGTCRSPTAAAGAAAPAHSRSPRPRCSST